MTLQRAKLRADTNADRLAQDSSPKDALRRTRSRVVVTIVALALGFLALLGGTAAVALQRVRPVWLSSGELGWIRTGGWNTANNGARVRVWVHGVDWLYRVDIDATGRGTIDLIAEDWEGPEPERCLRRINKHWVAVDPVVCKEGVGDGP